MKNNNGSITVKELIIVSGVGILFGIILFIYAVSDMVGEIKKYHENKERLTQQCIKDGNPEYKCRGYL